MTAELWPVPPPWWPAAAGAWPWDYWGSITADAVAADAAAFIAATRRFIAETDAELRREAERGTGRRPAVRGRRRDAAGRPTGR